MTRNELLRRFPNASPATIQANEDVATVERTSKRLCDFSKLTRADKDALYKKAIKIIYAKTDTDNTGTTAKLEHGACDGALATGKIEAQDSRRVHIRFESVRQRLCDPDNLSEKWLLDCLRNCGAIAGDEPDKITLETTQRKAAKGEEEHTQITITYP